MNNSENIDLLKILLTRTLELEWQLSKKHVTLSAKNLPQGLFKTREDEPQINYVTEVKNDIATLMKHTNPQVMYYLALKINQKISVLISVCLSCSNKPKFKLTSQDSLEKLSTRQQWLETLEKNIAGLKKQKDALMKRLNAQNAINIDITLALQQEIGELEKCLTLAQETYAGIIG